MGRYVVKPAQMAHGVEVRLWFISDTQSGELVRDKNNRLRSFNTPKAAQKAADKLNA